MSVLRYSFRFLFVCLSLFSHAVFMAGCSSKNSIGSKGDPGPASLELTKTPAKVQVGGETISGPLETPIFANIKILSEVTADGCNPALGKQESVKENFIVTPDEDLQITWPNDFKAAAVFNIQVKSMGFDESSYRYSSWDTRKTPTPEPYGIKIKWRGAGRIQIEFLDQIQMVQFDVTPVVTMQAREIRGGCKLIHQVNVWGEVPSGQ